MSFFYRKLIKPLLFGLDPEKAHEFVGGLGARTVKIPLVSPLLRGLYSYRSPRLRLSVSGIDFENPVGMAAGFDKSGELYPFLAEMGFGFIESGTFTALEQPGNPRPRLFRFPEQEALVNRMGFNNPGSDRVLKLLENQKKPLTRGVNIGKSKLAGIDEALADYEVSLRKLAHFGDYVAVNVSSPNTPDLRRLQEKSRLKALLSELQRILLEENLSRPLLVKIAPDLSEKELQEILDVALEIKLGGIIISNTTLDKSVLPDGDNIQGGLSGSPVRERSTQMIRKAYHYTQGSLPIIGVGGIFSGADALEKIKAGASLVQIYTGYIYQGPTLPARINRYLDKYCESQGVNLSELVGVGEG